MYTDTWFKVPPKKFHAVSQVSTSCGSGGNPYQVGLRDFYFFHVCVLSDRRLTALQQLVDVTSFVWVNDSTPMFLFQPFCYPSFSLSFHATQAVKSFLTVWLTMLSYLSLQFAQK